MSLLLSKSEGLEAGRGALESKCHFRLVKVMVWGCDAPPVPHYFSLGLHEYWRPQCERGDGKIGAWAGYRAGMQMMIWKKSTRVDGYSKTRTH